MKKLILSFLLLCSLIFSISAQQNVTLCVDMSCNPAAFTQPNVSGSFNGWGGTANPLFDDGTNGDITIGDNIWCTTLLLADGNYLYKFNADNWNIQENFVGGSECTFFDGNTNRTLTVAGAPISESYGWGSCAMPSCPIMGNITLCVDVTCISGISNVAAIGTFNGWNNTANPMTDDGMNGDVMPADGIYCTTVPNLAGGNYEYKFETNVTGQESLQAGSACTATTGGFTNRYLTVNGDASYTYGFQSCDANCNSPYNITLCVDMACNPNTFTQPNLSGGFNGWGGTANPLSDNGTNGDATAGDNIWCTTILLANGTYQYKFNADNWAIQESFANGQPCVINDNGNINRLLTVNGADATYSFGWNTCESPTCPVPGDVTFCVDVSCLSPLPTSVSIIGDFNGFNDTANPLADNGMNGDAAAGDNIWCGTITALSAGNHAYKFVTNTDGAETFGNGTSCTINQGGVNNRLISVNGNETVTHGWNSCNATCTSPSIVTFCVDVSCINSITSVAVVGGFNGWNNAANPMADDGMNGDATAADGIWCTQVALSNGSYEYKFETNVTGQESFAGGESCTVTNFGFTNRIVTVAGNATESFGFNSCNAICAVSYDITFCVDMSCAGAFTQPYIFGSFNGWNPTEIPLVNNGTLGDVTPGDDVWCNTLSLANGTFEYKFSYDGSGFEGFSGNDPCTTPPGAFVNRVVTVNNTDATYNYGWNSCNTVCPVSRTVTMCVDASCLGTPTTANIFGSFNGWNSTANPMAAQGGGFFCTPITFLEGNSYEYKFMVNGVEETFTPGSACTMTTGQFTNRVLAVDNTTASIVGYGFNSCTETCVAPLTIELMSFTGIATDKTNVLQWTTATERENDYFEIEYSTDGIHFEIIGKVEGAGNSWEAVNYAYIHENPSVVMNYYRLRQVDYSGAATLSDVLQIIRKGDASFDVIIRPSLVSDVANVDFPYPTEAATIIEIFDIQGKKVATFQVPVATMQHTLNTADFENGHYLVRITTGNESIVKRFVKI